MIASTLGSLLSVSQYFGFIISDSNWKKFVYYMNSLIISNILELSTRIII